MIQALFGGVSGAGGLAVALALLSWLRGRKKDRADVNRSNVAGAVALSTQSIEVVERLMRPLENRLAAADAKVDAASAEVDELRRKVRELTIEVAICGDQLEKATHRAESAEKLLIAHGLPLPGRRDEDWGNR